jgi:hypothetical protein
MNVALERDVRLQAPRNRTIELAPELWAAMLISVTLHLLLAILLVSNRVGSRTPHLARRVAVTISLEQFLPSRRPAASVGAPPPPPSAIAAVPKESRPRPPAPPKADLRRAPAPASQATQKTPQPPPQQESPPDDLLGRIQDIWLRPPGSVEHFRCRLRIDYAAGGVILAVRFLEKCGTAGLDDSVMRAVWKSQPIPLPAKSPSTGSIDIEFSP